MSKKWHIYAMVVIYVSLASLIVVHPAMAHEAPDQGAEWLMADWMLLSFLVFFMVALVAFIIALKRGMLTNIEDAKYHILTIDEPDYYTPDWAKEAEDDDSDRQ